MHFNTIKYIALLLVLIFFISLTGCKKSIQQKIIGKWEMVSYDGSEPSFTYEFMDGDQLNRYWKYKLPNGDDTTILDTAFYYIEVKNFRKNIRITKAEAFLSVDINGLWWIDNLESSLMELQRIETPDLEGGAYLRYEFIKK
ncbi:MAG: hypothetical protein A2275_16030 [Bacteroidetes bacterium RIFOXYA12_FULL_35_11]|nr:MAG: hypothetical protein A2X01_05200 [Bacteroidetes bacterium GWF2_35_48]OFY75888.1 MAG: hypothetical protein A2275_16030 [Bacteroidetes bacterium RIFOXYA12_FULL_35_11]OFY99376.1 MAG: hypothetical protein A2491_11430 [Bacteroidetes bacterium RIFOXYC12_FULL_35_7]HBX52150.1 hypothetical protein [Bacteroidales bacterium]